MDRNLGATTSEPNLGTTQGLHYQFGRKDPFSGSLSYDGERTILYDVRSSTSILKAEIIAYIIHSGFISGYQNRYGDNLKPPTNVYHRMTA